MGKNADGEGMDWVGRTDVLPGGVSPVVGCSWCPGMPNRAGGWTMAKWGWDVCRLTPWGPGVVSNWHVCQPSHLPSVVNRSTVGVTLRSVR